MKHYILSILMTTVIVVISLIPIIEMPHLVDIPLWDKWVHFVMYGGLCCVYWFDFYRNGNKGNDFKKWIIWIVLLPIALGGVMELCQKYLTTYRSGDWIDFAANTIGVLIAIPIGLVLIPRIARKFTAGK